MTATSDLVPVLKKLRLSGVLQTMELRVRQAIDDNLALPEFLYRLLFDEVERREGKQLEQRLRRANFDATKTLEDFDFTFNPKVPKAALIDLATCAFVEKRENILILGPAGVGKSHVSQAIGLRACQAGYTVLNISAHQLLTQLRASRADGSYDKRLFRFSSVDLLIVDDVGLRSLEREEPIDLYEVIRQRYERGAMILTSNRAIEEWPALFDNPLLASAAMDRLLHHSHIVVMDGNSYRNPPTKGDRGSRGPRK